MCTNGSTRRTRHAASHGHALDMGKGSAARLACGLCMSQTTPTHATDQDSQATG
jgi:hypothetical protein